MQYGPDKAHCLGLNPMSGFSMIEVLVTIVILVFGLLGLAGLQSRALTAQLESYQRAQAIVLLKDMADRINANRLNASAYVTTTRNPPYLGTDNAQGNCTAVAIGQPRDFCEWNNALLGAAEVQSGVAATNIGAMIGARGCIYQLQAPATGIPAVYQIVVAWQGVNATVAPDNSIPASTTVTSAGRCGVNLYKDRNSGVSEPLHRVISMPVTLGDLN